MTVERWWQKSTVKEDLVAGVLFQRRSNAEAALCARSLSPLEGGEKREGEVVNEASNDAARSSAREAEDAGVPVGDRPTWSLPYQDVSPRPLAAVFHPVP